MVYFGAYTQKPLFLCIFPTCSIRRIGYKNYSLIHKKREQATPSLSTLSVLSGAGDNAKAWKVFTVNKLVKINRQ